jgi:hypothetical protein
MKYCTTFCPNSFNHQIVGHIEDKYINYRVVTLLKNSEQNKNALHKQLSTADGKNAYVFWYEIVPSCTPITDTFD